MKIICDILVERYEVSGLSDIHDLHARVVVAELIAQRQVNGGTAHALGVEGGDLDLSV